MQSFKHGRKVSLMDLNEPTPYMRFALHGGTVRIMASLIPRMSSTDFSSFLVAVAVSAMIFTFSGSRLQILPFLIRVIMKV